MPFLPTCLTRDKFEQDGRRLKEPDADQQNEKKVILTKSSIYSILGKTKNLPLFYLNMNIHQESSYNTIEGFF